MYHYNVYVFMRSLPYKHAQISLPYKSIPIWISYHSQTCKQFGKSDQKVI